ncbi:MAG TPA: cob(I)yrinic acid a,c-diamide adenosyltransferase [Ktedonobacterales bacterium]
MAKVTTAKVTTGSGDTGYTSLLGDQRVPKYDPRPDTYGTVDEATSALGMARALTSDADARQHILTMQRQLYVLMAELATPPEHQAAVGMRITAEDVQALEHVEDELQRAVNIPTKFVIPGDSPDGAALDLARTIVRRAERLCAKLLHEGTIQNGEVVRYLNRLSDVVFILARYLEAKQGGSTLIARK